MGPPGAPGGPLSREPLYLSLSELGRRKIVRKDLGGVLNEYYSYPLMGGGLTHSQTGTAQSGWPSTADRHTACRHCRRPFLHQPPEIAQFNYFLQNLDSKLTESSVPGGLSSPDCPVCCKKPGESQAFFIVSNLVMGGPC